METAITSSPSNQKTGMFDIDDDMAGTPITQPVVSIGTLKTTIQKKIERSTEQIKDLEKTFKELGESETDETTMDIDKKRIENQIKESKAEIEESLRTALEMARLIHQKANDRIEALKSFIRKNNKDTSDDTKKMVRIAEIMLAEENSTVTISKTNIDNMQHLLDKAPHLSPTEFQSILNATKKKKTYL